MANAIVEIVASPGQTLTLSLFPLGSDTAAASGKALAERTNDKGTYRATVTEGLTGWYRAKAFSGATAVAGGYVKMDDTATDHRVRDEMGEVESLDALATTAPVGPATTFPQMVVQMWRRAVKKSTKADGLLKTFGDDGTTVLTTQAVVEGDSEEVGAAT